MHEGKKRRIDRIFAEDGKSIIVAMDHAAFMPTKFNGLNNPANLIKEVLSNGADALLTTFGTIRTANEEIGTSAVIMSVESYPKDLEEVIIQAIQYDIDMIKVMVYPFFNEDSNNVWNFQKLATFADKWNLPIMAEVFPGGYSAEPEWYSIEKLSSAIRVAAEMGADLIKTYYIDDQTNEFRSVIEYAQVPVVILGGEKSNNIKLLFEKIVRGIDAGAKGVAIGRNIWGYEKPGDITAAISEILHKGTSIDQALALLSK